MELFDENLERPATQDEREYVERALGQYGLVDATLFDWPIQTDHPEDDKWIVQGEK